VTAEKGNVFYKPEELTAGYYPVSTVVQNWKNQLEKNIDNYLPQDLKIKSFSLIPLHQYNNPMNIKKLTSAPSIPGAMQQF
jgi:hypothetical protein